MKKIGKCDNCGSTKSKEFWEFEDKTILCDDCHNVIGDDWDKIHGYPKQASHKRNGVEAHKDKRNGLSKEYTYAGFGIRLLAYLIDFFIVLIVTVLFVASTDGDTDIIYLFLLIYFTIFESSSMMATIGKRILNLKVMTNGMRIGFFRALFRNIIKISFPISSLCILFFRDNSALHDLLCTTSVVRFGFSEIETIKALEDQDTKLALELNYDVPKKDSRQPLRKYFLLLIIICFVGYFIYVELSEDTKSRSSDIVRFNGFLQINESAHQYSDGNVVFTVPSDWDIGVFEDEGVPLFFISRMEDAAAGLAIAPVYNYDKNLSDVLVCKLMYEDYEFCTSIGSAQYNGSSGINVKMSNVTFSRGFTRNGYSYVKVNSIQTKRIMGQNYDTYEKGSTAIIYDNDTSRGVTIDVNVPYLPEYANLQHMQDLMDSVYFLNEPFNESDYVLIPINKSIVRMTRNLSLNEYTNGQFFFKGQNGFNVTLNNGFPIVYTLCKELNETCSTLYSTYPRTDDNEVHFQLFYDNQLDYEFGSRYEFYLKETGIISHESKLYEGKSSIGLRYYGKDVFVNDGETYYVWRLIIVYSNSTVLDRKKAVVVQSVTPKNNYKSIQNETVQLIDTIKFE